MSIDDPIEIEYQKNRTTFILMRGRETFYDEDRGMIEFDTIEEAKEWSRENLGIEPLDPSEEFQRKMGGF